MSAPSSDRAGIRQAIRALRRDGWELVAVLDGDGGNISVKAESEAVDAVTAVDESYLHMHHNEHGLGAVYFVLGNDPDEVICDYTMNMDQTLETLIDEWIKG